MDKEKLARKLIDAVHGAVDEHTIEYVLSCFEGIIEGTNKNWESHIAEVTNDVLAYDKVSCPRCALKLEVKRTRQAVYSQVSEEKH